MSPARPDLICQIVCQTCLTRSMDPSCLTRSWTQLHGTRSGANVRAVLDPTSRFMATSRQRAPRCAGPGGVVHERGPGAFLQGLATYGPSGNLLPGPSLPPDVVRSCFDFSRDAEIACVAFLGDTCVSTAMRPYVRELHTRYYEPLAEVRAVAKMPCPPANDDRCRK
jgi:hypothetical protein